VTSREGHGTKFRIRFPAPITLPAASS
jgi:signal transduction histidine kinase